MWPQQVEDERFGLGTWRVNVFTSTRIGCCTVKRFESMFTLHCSSSLSCVNEYLVIDSVDVYTRSLRAVIAAWLDASQRCWNGVCLSRSVREVKCKPISLDHWILQYIRTYLLTSAWFLLTHLHDSVMQV